MTDERRKMLESIPGFIVLIRKPGDDSFYGITEHSLCLNVEQNRTFMYWSSIVGSGGVVDGHQWCKRDVNAFKENHPDWEYDIFDARSLTLPVTIDWEKWIDAHELREGTLSGIKDKYWARNLSFRPFPRESRVQRQFELEASRRMTFELEESNGVQA